MKSYLEIQVPIPKNNPWIERLGNAMVGIPIRYEKRKNKKINRKNDFS
jgi:hypothetical protein